MQSFNNDIQSCITVLKSGGLILYPTDTIWGLGCDATNDEAVKKIYALKKREEKKSMIILVNNEQMIREFVSDASRAILQYMSTQVKPTTAIFPNAKNLPATMINSDGTIAIRIVKDPFCQALIDAYQKPVVSTSANISGEKYPENFAGISPKIKNGVDYIVEHRQNDSNPASPSSIIRLDASGQIQFLR